MNTTKPVDILGVRIDPLTKKQTLEHIEDILESGKRGYIATPNPEICLKASRSYAYLETINSATLRIPDGVGLQWAAAFLANKRGIRNARYLNVPIMFFDWLFTTLRFTLSRKYQSSIIPETIHGSDLINDIASIAEKKKLSLFLLGAEEGVAKKTADVLQKKFPKLKIAGAHSGSPKKEKDTDIQKRINSTKADILFVAFGAPNQETWIQRNLQSIDIRLAMSVGGSFDFISGNIERAPLAYQEKKIEWLWRLKVQSWRKKRIKDAVMHFPYQVFLSKVYAFRPYRPNVLCVIMDKKTRFLILNNSYIYNKSRDQSHWQFLQGGKRPYESVEKAALRESKEEMGSSSLTILGIADKMYSYKWPVRNLRLKRPYKGQQQRIVFIKYTGDYSDIKIDPAEHSDYKWVEKNELIKELHPVRRAVTKIVLNELDKKNILSKL